MFIKIYLTPSEDVFSNNTHTHDGYDGWHDECYMVNKREKTRKRRHLSNQNHILTNKDKGTKHKQKKIEKERRKAEKTKNKRRYISTYKMELQDTQMGEQQIRELQDET